MVLKLKEGYLAREIAGCYIVVPVGERVIDFKGIMTLNDTGYFIWKNLSADTTESNLLSAVLNEYEIDEATARADLEKFLSKARECGVLEE